MARKNDKSGWAGMPVLHDTALNRISRKRQELIRPILENPRPYVLLTARGLAKKLRVDPATIVRTVSRMGFGSYREFQHYLHELVISRATSLDTMQASKTVNASLAAHVGEAIDNGLNNLQRLRNSADFRRLAKLAARMHAAKRILIFAGDLAESLALFLYYHLLIIGLPAVQACSAGQIAHAAGGASKTDLAIAISFRRCLRQTVEGMQKARANGAYCVGITDTFVSPVARFAHESFLTSVDTPSYGASYVAPMSLLDGLIAACAYYRSGRTKTLLKKAAAEQRQGFRWFPV